MIRVFVNNNNIYEASISDMNYKEYVKVEKGSSENNTFYYINTDDIIKAINHVKLFLRIN